MRLDPFAVVDDPAVADVLRRLHRAADRQTPRLLAHYLPAVPSLLLRRPLHFDESGIRGFYADKFTALDAPQAALCHLVARRSSAPSS